MIIHRRLKSILSKNFRHRTIILVQIQEVHKINKQIVKYVKLGRCFKVVIDSFHKLYKIMDIWFNNIIEILSTEKNLICYSEK